MIEAWEDSQKSSSALWLMLWRRGSFAEAAELC
jgi:hypothetical protein